MAKMEKFKMMMMWRYDATVSAAVLEGAAYAPQKNEVETALIKFEHGCFELC